MCLKEYSSADSHHFGLSWQAVPDLRKGALSAAYCGGPSVVFFLGLKYLFPSKNLHFGRPKTKFQWFQKAKKKKTTTTTTNKQKQQQQKGDLLPPPLSNWAPLTYLLAQIFLSILSLFFFFFWRGPWFFGWGPVLVGPVSSCWHCCLLNLQLMIRPSFSGQVTFTYGCYGAAPLQQSVRLHGHLVDRLTL